MFDPASAYLYTYVCFSGRNREAPGLLAAVRVWLARLAYVSQSHIIASSLALQSLRCLLRGSVSGLCLSVCVSVCRCVCLACCVPLVLVSGGLKLYFLQCCLFLKVCWSWLFGWNVENALPFCVILLANVLMAQLVVMTTQNSLLPICTPLNSHHVIIPFFKL